MARLSNRSITYSVNTSMTQPGRLLSLLLAIAGLTACAGPVTAPPVGETAYTTNAQNDPRYPWPQVDWWKRLHDPKLEELIATGLAQNPNLMATAQRIDQATAVANAIGATFEPEINAKGSVSAERFAENYVQNRLAGQSFGALVFSPISLRFHLDFWGRDRAAMEAAIGTVRAREAELAQARALLSTALARTYVRLANAEASLMQAKHLVDFQANTVRLLNVRRQAGLDTRLAVRPAEIRHIAARQRAARIDTEVQVLRHQLAALTGQSLTWSQAFQITSPSVHPQLPLPSRLPLSLIGRRADIAATRWMAEAAAQDVRLAKTLFFPDVNLVGFAGFQTVDLSDFLFAAKNVAYSLGPSIELPLFQGGRLEGNLSQKEAAFNAAVATYHNAVLRAIQETADALARRKLTMEILQDQTSAWRAASDRAQLSRSLRQSGLSSRLQVLENEVTAEEQLLQRTLLEGDEDVNAINLIEALGGGYSTETSGDKKQ